MIETPDFSWLDVLGFHRAVSHNATGTSWYRLLPSFVIEVRIAGMWGRFNYTVYYKGTFYAHPRTNDELREVVANLMVEHERTN